MKSSIHCVPSDLDGMTHPALGKCVGVLEGTTCYVFEKPKGGVTGSNYKLVQRDQLDIPARPAPIISLGTPTISSVFKMLRKVLR
jgi:hypothetical protein